MATKHTVEVWGRLSKLAVYLPSRPDDVKNIIGWDQYTDVVTQAFLMYTQGKDIETEIAKFISEECSKLD